jgi:tRNA wybutosine-synthesizing protein 1
VNNASSFFFSLIVYRLTLVKDYNTEEIANYVELVRRGKPDFIEVKGVTYCGYGGASKLTMANVS